MSANGSWLIESTLTSQHDIKSFFDLEIYLSTFNSLKHLKVHLTILTLQDYVIPSKLQYYGLLRHQTITYDLIRSVTDNEMFGIRKITLVIAFSRFIIGIIFFGSFILIAKAFLGFSTFPTLDSFVWNSFGTLRVPNSPKPMEPPRTVREQGRNFKGSNEKRTLDDFVLVDELVDSGHNHISILIWLSYHCIELCADSSKKKMSIGSFPNGAIDVQHKPK